MRPRRRGSAAQRDRLLVRAAGLRQRVADLPDPDDVLVAYLPSRTSEGGESGLAQAKALAICRRLVAVHCLYGVDKNPLAVELAKLSLWLESYAEGLPLTFLDHRLICGDSLTGPFFEHLLTYPVSGKPLDDLFAQGLTDRLTAILSDALTHVRDLEASVGKDVADLEQKRAAKARLDAALEPLKQLARAWSGAVMLGDVSGDAVVRRARAGCRRKCGLDPGQRPARAFVDARASGTCLRPRLPGGLSSNGGPSAWAVSTPCSEIRHGMCLRLESSHFWPR